MNILFAAKITKYAQRYDACMIAVGACRQGELARIFRGSAADRVAKDRSVAVLLLK